MSARRNEAQTRLTRLVDNLRQTEEELRAKNYQLTSATDEVRPCRPLTRVCSDGAFTMRVWVPDCRAHDGASKGGERRGQRDAAGACGGVRAPVVPYSRMCASHVLGNCTVWHLCRQAAEYKEANDKQAQEIERLKKLLAEEVSPRVGVACARSAVRRRTPHAWVPSAFRELTTALPGCATRLSGGVRRRRCWRAPVSVRNWRTLCAPSARTSWWKPWRR